ncbi:NAD(+) diphosphatase [Naumannella sp. ID2617S]|nr:NAD(+) diphosphatase [Naumannella sp. ID2617S]
MDYWNRGSLLDRVDAQRADPEWVARQWREGARLVRLDSSGRVACTPDRTALRSEAAAGAYDGQRQLLLGQVAGQSWFAECVDAGELGEADTLRRLNSTLSDAQRDLATAAVAVSHWHRLDPRCPGCGSETRVANGGFVRECPCGRILFPRTDSAVIVAILDDRNRVLLGHQRAWDGGRVSTFAGFVEAGESLEQAVHREMAEETGLELSSVEYFGSQPWPFPRSLMLGFVARAVSSEHRVDGEEIEYAEWFTPAELEQAVADGRCSVPGPGTIARRLLDAWLAGRFGGEDSGIVLNSTW